MSGPKTLWPQGGGAASYPPSYPHRVRIDAPQEIRDPNTGARTQGWVLVRDDVPAHVKAMSGKEFIAAQTAGSAVNTRIIIPWLEGIEARMRVVHESSLYDIHAVLPDETQRMHLTLLCEKGMSRG